jgi:hypothetical protein
MAERTKTVMSCLVVIRVEIYIYIAIYIYILFQNFHSVKMSNCFYHASGSLATIVFPLCRNMVVDVVVVVVVVVCVLRCKGIT